MRHCIPMIQWWCAGLIACCVACNPEKQQHPLFVLLDAETTGVSFSNDITEYDSLNVIDFPYIYNGGGVGIGDFNKDGLEDLFFAGNMVRSRLYINQGHFKFKDITETAGLTPHRWSTGVSVVDINQDGWLDIYVCAANKFEPEESKNLLFINNRTSSPTFTESAEAYGLADDGYSTQAAFLDYDLDGDLDMYLLTNGMESFNHNNSRPKKVKGEGVTNDKLYRNEGVGPNGHPVFREVTQQAGILKEGYGLGVAVNDINQDGLPDIYVANDFITNDLLWINKGDGTFTDKAPEFLKHQTQNGMGTDIADYNNDGLDDIVVLDMLPEDNLRQKTMMGKPNYDKFMLNLDFDYAPQYIRNTLQLNNGTTPQGNLSFSEIGQLAGVYKTDWSWSALMSDYDNDGYRDLLITNGYGKDVTDLDYIVYLSSSSQFGNQTSRREKTKEAAALLKEAKIHNYIFQNNHDLTFTDVSAAWGLETPSFSNGAAFADLDNDGDLDLAINNINAPAFIYENKAETLGHHVLRIRLEGPENNKNGLGADLNVWYAGNSQHHYHSVVRGYTSTVENTIHFGLGKHSQVDSLEIVWPDGKRQQLTHLPSGELLPLRYQDATDTEKRIKSKPNVLFTQSDPLAFQHQETDFADFKYQPLLHRKYSQDGPGVAVGDINGDGLDDLYVGGAKEQSGSFFIQQPSGTFTAQVLGLDERSEDMGALLFDADNDKDLDLYVVSGGNEYHSKHPAYQDRLYTNDGQGNFTKNEQVLPEMLSSGSCVTASDFDRDGDLDLFVGGRVTPQQYPVAPFSHLLRNDQGTFTDITSTVCPELRQAGMVTAALWTDFNQDHQMDLIVTGEWMPIRFFAQEDGKLKEVTAATSLLNMEGWWNSLVSGDFDRDGDLDYVAGNVGLNNPYHASPQEPVSLYAKDFNSDGTIDPVMGSYIMGQEYPVHPRDALTEQIIGMRRRFPRYAMYAEATLTDLFTEQELEGAYIVKSKTMASCYLENLGNGKFQKHTLPLKAQFAPVYGMAVLDVNRDENPDLILVGNSYATNVLEGWYDAGIGTVLAGNGQGGFTPLSLQESGFFVDTDAKGMATYYTADEKAHLLISVNNDSTQVWTPQHTPRQTVVLQPQEYYALLQGIDGKRYRQEFYFGEAYLSQSARRLSFDPTKVSQVQIFDYQGNVREIPIEEMLTDRK